MILNGLSALLCLCWFFLPIGAGALPEATVFIPYTMPSAYAAAAPGAIQGILLYAIYLVPLLSIFSIVSFLIGKKLGAFGSQTGIFLSISRILSTTIMLFATVLPVLKFADTISYFTQITPVMIVCAIVALSLNIVSVVAFLRLLNIRNPIYREYKEYRKMQKLNLPAAKGIKLQTGIEVLYRIRTKLFFAFIGIISLTLLIMSSLLLSNYRATLLKAIGDGAKSQVEQASANYRINLGDNIALFEYFNRQIELNEKANFKYNDLTVFTNLKKEVYLDKPGEDLPEYPGEYSTLAPGIQYPQLPPITGAMALEYIKNYSQEKIGFLQQDKESYKFISPIIKIDTIKNGEARIKRERLLGFSIMTFDRQVIMKPYFKTQNMVIALTAFFIYLSIILTYVVGNYIVNPLLFLRMNVRKISDILALMIRGQSRVSATTLIYTDCITSRDEIKSLSTEINEMVTVIRGIIPYISASTLKQAEKGIASSTQKDLAFLFTDIRGFTTLCEGMEPDQVVGVLNRYLDLETEIILNNKGDVDKFVGDEMMAFFEGPEKEINACRAAMQIRYAMMEEKERREKEGLPVVAIGIGINAGPVVFGSVGARDRMDFTSIGDTVNLAARLEGANKAYGSKSIITEVVYEKVKEQFLCRELDYIAVKGKNEPVRIYEILQENTVAHPKLLELKTYFEAGLADYRARKWVAAMKAFKKNVELYKDSPSEVFLERAEHFTKNPPDTEWDGVFRMTVK